MPVRNVHERRIGATAADAGALLEALSSPLDRLWPSDRWPPLHLDRGLELGSGGGHGPIRYAVIEHLPGRRAVFRFAPRMGMEGTHTLEVLDTGDAVVLRHLLEGRPSGRMRLIWPLVIRPLHDALIEDLLDGAEAALAGRSPVRRGLPLTVRLRRELIGRLGTAAARTATAPS